MPPSTPENLRRLALRFQPSLHFSSGERHYPIQAESWLSHVSYASWAPTDDPAIPAEAAGGEHHRGTAVMGANRTTDPFPHTRLAGGPNPAGSPLSLSRAGPDAIGNSAFRWPQAPGDLFLTFGGWKGPALTEGCPDYLYGAFSELASAMDPSNAWVRFEQLPNRPIVWFPQPTAPTVYAEAEWAGMYGRVDADPALRAANGNRSSFGGPVDTVALERLLVVTYYYLFPMRDVGGDPGAVSAGNAEGQWEAVSLFFTGQATETTQGERRPAFEVDDRDPVAIALSRPRQIKWLPMECLPYSYTLTTDGGNPIVFASLGAHRLSLYPPPAEAPNYSRGNGGAASTSTRLDESDPGKGDFPGSEVLLIPGLILASPLLLFLWLLTFLLGLNNEAFTESEGAPDPTVPTPEGDGAGPVGAPSEGAGPGTRLSDGSRVDDPALTIFRFVNMFDPDPQETSWPQGFDPKDPPPAVERPFWWEFAGRWGVEVAGPGWASGDRRIDQFRRTIGFDNAIRLAEAWARGLIQRPLAP
jgi:hypothetical protein